MQAFLGTILPWPVNWAPLGWALCQGQLLNISQNTALFSLIGTTYGGNGQTTFALPDLRGRTVLGQGQGPGLGNYVIGEQAGTENVTISINQMPAHTHNAIGQNATGTSYSPGGQYVADSGDPRAGGPKIYTNTNTASMQMAPMIQPTGGSQPTPNMQPYLCLNYIIALQGIYPSRS